jgi:hypothetical protein
MMNTKEVDKKENKPFIIANPIYDTVFKRLMEDVRIVKFFLSTILKQTVTSVEVLPQEFTYKLGDTEKNKDEKDILYSVFRIDFKATVLTEDGKYRKVLIEVQKSLGKIGSKLPDMKCTRMKINRVYTDMDTEEPIDERSDVVEKLTHDSYFIQVGRITDNRYSTRLEKLFSIFEQAYFVDPGSEVVKEYRYQPGPEDEEIKLITGILHEMGVDPAERKRIEDEEEAIRTIYDTYAAELLEKEKIIEEKDKIIEEEKKKREERDKENAVLLEKLTEMEHLLRNKQG